MNSYINGSIVDMSAEEYLNVIINLSEEIFHDFKNTLATISGISQMTAIGTVSDDIRENLELIKEATFECRNQIDRFYGLIRGYNVDIEQGEIFSNIVFTVLDMIKHKIGKLNYSAKSIILNVNIHSVAKVHCNEYKMKQAILNIIMNAVDAMEEKGGILEVNLFETSNEIVLEIVDTGIGIAEDKLEKIFEANYTTKGINGTGLGLKVSKSVFEEYGGRIEVESKLGKGTIFTIYLPISS